MSEPRGGDLLLDLNRPQYVSVPEALITSLAWSAYSVSQPKSDLPREAALVYRMLPRKKASRTLVFKETQPQGPSLLDFAEGLEELGVRAESDAWILASAIVDDLGGVMSSKGGVQAAIPMTPALGLMQNMRGLQAAANPPAVDKILERMYWLGAPLTYVGGGAAERWRRASRQRCEVDPLAKAIDGAMVTAVLGAQLVPTALPEQQGKGLFESTPFGWFHEAWIRITSEAWVTALPARVWVDWASTVLRLAVGCGYLWEVAWYEALARKVVSGRIPNSWDDLVRDVPDTIPWATRSAAISVRDIAVPIGWRVRRAEAVRKTLAEWVDKHPDFFEDPAIDCLARMSKQPELRDALTADLSSRERSGSANNLWEAIKYALKIREVSGPSADYYGLLSGSGRYLVPSPGPEWVAAIASLACGKPGGTTNVGKLQHELARLGLRPAVSELIWHLERAGMARGSADADQGVEITAAFDEVIA